MGRLISQLWDWAFGPLIWIDHRPEHAAHIPDGCSCVWLLRLGNVGVSWALTRPDPTCRKHGGNENGDRM